MTGAHQVPERQSWRSWAVQAYVAANAIGALCTILAILYVLFFRSTPAPPFQFETANVVPDTGRVCPGDNLAWDVKATVTPPWDDGDTERVLVVTFYRSIWSRDSHQTILPAMGHDASTRNYFEPELVTNRISLAVPDLPPGKYEVRTSAIVQGGYYYARGYRVPFTIIEGC